MRKERINKLLQICKPIWDCNFGDDKFIKILQNGFDILCHHGAQVYNYNSPNFDYIYALERNTHNIQSVMKNMCNLGTYKIILTGSVFEQDDSEKTMFRC
jgi:UDP-glucose 4-epimerase